MAVAMRGSHSAGLPEVGQDRDCRGGNAVDLGVGELGVQGMAHYRPSQSLTASKVATRSNHRQQAGMLVNRERVVHASFDAESCQLTPEGVALIDGHGK